MKLMAAIWLCLIALYGLDSPSDVQAQQSFNFTEPQTTTATKSTATKKMLPALIILGVVLLTGGGVVFFFLKKRKGEATPQSSGADGLVLALAMQSVLKGAPDPDVLAETCWDSLRLGNEKALRGLIITQKELSDLTARGIIPDGHSLNTEINEIFEKLRHVFLEQEQRDFGGLVDLNAPDRSLDDVVWLPESGLRLLNASGDIAIPIGSAVKSTHGWKLVTLPDPQTISPKIL